MTLTQWAHARAPPACSGAADKHEGVEYLAYASHGVTAGITVPWAHSCGAVSCGAHACTPLKSAAACGPYRLRRALSHCARRAGRTLETPGEDPFLNGEYGASHTQGLQVGMNHTRLS
jgi:hypothetical protein